MLVFKKWAVFKDTFEPYRHWSVYRDMPAFDLPEGGCVLELGPDSRDSATEKHSWDGCRFQARTSDDTVIRYFEDWQVPELFDGRDVPPWPLEGEVLQRMRRALLDARPLGKAVLADVADALAKMLEYVVKDAPKGQPFDDGTRYLATGQPGPLARLRSLVSDGYEAAFHATVDVPDTPIREGDIVLRLSRYGKETNPEPEGLRGWRQRVPRGCLRTAADHVGGTLEVLETERNVDLAKLTKGLRMAGRPQWSDDTSPLLIVRPLIAPVSEPIQAGSDDVAIFELLYSVGGRMPSA